MRLREDYRTMSGAEKAALLLMSVGEDNAPRLFSLMDDDEIRELSQAMANLGNVSAQMVERLLVEFADQISSTGSLVGNFDNTERLLAKVMDKDRVGNIMEEIRGPAGRTMWEKLANVNEPCWRTTSRTNTRRPSPSFFRRSNPSTPPRCSPCFPSPSPWK